MSPDRMPVRPGTTTSCCFRLERRRLRQPFVRQPIVQTTKSPKYRLRDESHAEARFDGAADLARERDDFVGARAVVTHERERMFGRDPDVTALRPFREPGVL